MECNRSFRGWLQKIFFEESGYVPIKSDSFWVSSLPAWSHYSNFLWKSLILNGVGFLIVIIFCWHLNWIQSVGRFMCSHHRVSSSVTLLTTQIRSSPCCMKDWVAPWNPLHPPRISHVALSGCLLRLLLWRQPTQFGCSFPRPELLATCLLSLHFQRPHSPQALRRKGPRYMKVCRPQRPALLWN